MFFFLAYFTLYNRLQFHPSHQNWFKWILFNGWVIFHCVYVPQLSYPFICWWTSRLFPCPTVWRFLKKLQIELPYDPAIPLLGIHTKETRIERDTCTPMFITALFTIARTWKQPRCLSSDDWIKNLCYIYTMEYYLLLEKFFWVSSNEVDESGAYYTEWSASERNSPIQYINAYIRNLERW